MATTPVTIGTCGTKGGRQKMMSLNTFKSVMVHEAVESDFYNWDVFLKMFYRDFKKKVKHNHIFSVSNNSLTDNKLEVDLRQSNLAEHPTVKHNAIKRDEK